MLFDVMYIFVISEEVTCILPSGYGAVSASSVGVGTLLKDISES